MNTGTRVTLVSFNGRHSAPADTPSNEDYWKLIGFHGTLIDGGDERAHFSSSGPDARACVEFDRDFSVLGLEAHNRVNKSLWILYSDLYPSEKGAKPSVRNNDLHCRGSCRTFGNREMIRRIPHFVWIIGALMLFAAFVCAMFFGGSIPYQDPTPEMRAQELAEARTGERILSILAIPGLIIFLIGILLVAVQKLLKKLQPKTK